MFDSKQAILNLRGTFLLPELETQGFLRRFGYGDIAHVVPIDENHLIVHTDISIFLYTLSTQEKLWEIDCPSFNFAIDISHGIVVLIPEDKIVTLWNMHTGELLHQFIYRNENSEKAAYRVNPNGLELSYDGNILAVGMQNNHESVVTLWNTTNGHLVRVLALGNHLNDITTLAFHPDGNILAGGSFNNHKVWFWSLDDGSLLNVWDLELSENNHRDRPYDLAFSYDGTRLFVGSGTCGLRVWDVKQKQEITCPLSVADVQPTWLAVDPSGHFLALVHSPGIQNQMLHILDIENWRTVYTFSGEFSCPSFSLDGRLLAVGPARRGPVHFINVATGQELAQFQLRDFLGASLALPYPSKNILAEARNDQIRLWDTHDNSLLYDLQFPPLEKGSTVSIAFNPQRPLLAVSRRFGFKQFFIDLWDVSDGTFLFHLEGIRGLY